MRLAAIATGVVGFAIMNAYAVWFAGIERTLYVADQLTYWAMARNLAAALSTQPFAALLAVARSVAANEINLLPAVPIAVVFLLVNGSRLTYLLAVLDIYGVAAVAGMAYAMIRVGRASNLCRGWSGWWAPVGTVLVLVPMWRPVFIGYLGIGGLTVAFLVLAIVLPGPPSRRPMKYLVVAGAMLAVLAVFRRWYTIWSVGFLVMVAFDAAWTAVASGVRSLRGLWDSFKGPVMLGTSALATILVLAAPVTIARLRGGYTERFSAYALGSARDRMAAIVNEYGVLLLALLALCSVILVWRSTTRRTAVLLIVQLGVTYGVTVAIQDHSPQHWYLNVPAAALLLGLGIATVVDRANRAWVKWTMIGAVLITGVGSVFALFVGPAEVIADALGPLVPAHRVRPAVRGDLHEIERLLGDLDRLGAQYPGGIYVLASSGTLSDHVLAFANLSLGTSFRSPRTVLQAAHVDLRDGFPRGLLNARIVVVGDPVQTHLKIEDQQVVVVPAKAFLAGDAIAKAFVRLPESYLLRGGVRVSVFLRTRDLLPEEVAELSALLRVASPDRPFVFFP